MRVTNVGDIELIAATTSTGMAALEAALEAAAATAHATCKSASTTHSTGAGCGCEAWFSFAILKQAKQISYQIERVSAEPEGVESATAVQGRK